MSDQARELVRRLDAVEKRLSTCAGAELAAGALTAPDPPSGERWEAGQVWAHIAEFIPYWLGEAAHVIEDGALQPTRFGRTKSDPGRVAAIERDRHSDRSLLWKRVAGDIVSLRAFLAGLDPAAWSARGLHSTLGEMDLGHLVDEFLVGHLEQHADQLEGLASTAL
ncbi:MAG: hypothetical protein JF887_06040 [Candidatus Dormibacteraeota bacterium]|uniref:DinB-like domain-containing protein n=1 Tax=Candidatus Amunia macphersoniae TaxID=3127014 RepID=A0A934NFR9_9BACT|nr:hypothetical protein [Candidatus Dormibacteraeota bacterium]